MQFFVANEVLALNTRKILRWIRGGQFGFTPQMIEPFRMNTKIEVRPGVRQFLYICNEYETKD